jgi:hypothetical protein
MALYKSWEAVAWVGRPINVYVLNSSKAWQYTHNSRFTYLKPVRSLQSVEHGLWVYVYYSHLPVYILYDLYSRRLAYQPLLSCCSWLTWGLGGAPSNHIVDGASVIPVQTPKRFAAFLGRE